MIISIIRLQIAVHTAKLFYGFKMPPYVVVYRRGISTTYGGQKSKFGFVAVLRVMNEEGIDVHIPVGYKCEIGAAS